MSYKLTFSIRCSLGVVSLIRVVSSISKRSSVNLRESERGESREPKSSNHVHIRMCSEKCYDAEAVNSTRLYELTPNIMRAPSAFACSS